MADGSSALRAQLPPVEADIVSAGNGLGISCQQLSDFKLRNFVFEGLQPTSHGLQPNSPLSLIAHVLDYVPHKSARSLETAALPT